MTTNENTAPSFNPEWDERARGPRMSETTGRTIFKYNLPFLERCIMELPRGAKIIRVDAQGGFNWLWAEVDTNEPVEPRTLMAFKTGAPMPEGVELKYLGFCPMYIYGEIALYYYEVL